MYWGREKHTHRVMIEEWDMSLLRRSGQPILKGINPGYSLEGLMLKLKLQYFDHLVQRADSLKKPLILGKIEGQRRGGRQRMRWWGWHHRLDGPEFEQTLGDSAGQRSLAVGSQRAGCDLMTERPQQSA